MTKEASSYKRQGKRAIAHVGWIAAVIGVIFVGFFSMQGIVRTAPYRQSVVIVGDPVRVVSWNALKSQITILDIPQDVTIDATSGYGKYAVGSLFKLDDLDHKNGTLFVSSVSDAVGLPISWYIVPSDPKVLTEPGVSMIRRLFSWSSILAILTHQIKSSVPLGVWLSFVAASQSISADGVVSVDARNAFIDHGLPDGSSVRALDQSRLDYLTNNAFLDSGLRSEGLSVAVYNTTDIPSVGQHAARLMTRLGIQLLFVGNSHPAREDCAVVGSQKALVTKTTQFIKDYFHCKNGESQGALDNPTGADIVVLLGKQYATQFAVQN